VQISEQSLGENETIKSSFFGSAEMFPRPENVSAGIF
jgi:hypothetical protein